MDNSLKKSFYFIRHGQTDWNKKNWYQGGTDIPLNQTGKDQAKKKAVELLKLNIRQILSLIHI